MSEYLNIGKLVKELVDRRDPRYLALSPKIVINGVCVTLRVARTPEYKLNFSFLVSNTHTFSCTGDGNFSGVSA